MGAGRVHLGQVNLAEQDRFFVANAGDDFSQCAGDKTLLAKLDACTALLEQRGDQHFAAALGYWPGSREIFAPSARSLPSMSS